MQSKLSTTIACASLFVGVLGIANCGNAPPGGTASAEPLESKPSLLVEDRSIGAQVVQEGDAWVVKGIVPGSPAEAAGLQPEDVLLSVGDFPLAELNEKSYGRLKAAFNKGNVEISVVRHGANVALSSTTAAAPDVLPALFGNGEANSAYYCYWDCLGPYCYSAAPYAYWCGSCFSCISM
jgi:predicted metalloprotease with PDZ domain